MYHIVYEEDSILQRLNSEESSMIIRMLNNKETPYGKVRIGDEILFINSIGSTDIIARAQVDHLFNSLKLNEQDCEDLLNYYSARLNLTNSEKELCRKFNYFVLVGVTKFEFCENLELEQCKDMPSTDWVICNDGKLNLQTVKTEVT